MDIHVMIDAIAAVMAMEDKEFYKVGELAVAVMIETASAITGDAYKVKNPPLVPLYSLKNLKMVISGYEGKAPH